MYEAMGFIDVLVDDEYFVGIPSFTYYTLFFS